MAKQRILVIEDDMDVAELLIMFFDAQGYEVFHADSGGLGVALARAKLPNLILLDIMLPDMDGFDVCRELRSANLTKYIPTIFLTQRNARADKVSGLELGADDYITKPFDVEELRVRVQRSIHTATRDHLHEKTTGLPTGPVIEEQYHLFLQAADPWQRMDIRIVGSDVFRDTYGFLTANDALSLAAKVLSDKIIQYGTKDDFIGFVEDAYFVAFSFSPKVAQMIKEAKAEFTERVAALYKFTDVEQGYILIDEGTAHEKHIPLMHFDIRVQDSVAS